RRRGRRPWGRSPGGSPGGSRVSCAAPPGRRLRGPSPACRRRPPCARRPPATGGRGPETSPRALSSGRDAGAGVLEDGLHAVFGHQLQLLQLAHSPLLVGRERGGSFERLEFLVVGPVVGPEAPELLVLGHQSFDEGLLFHCEASFRWRVRVPRVIPARYSAGSLQVSSNDRRAPGSGHPRCTPASRTPVQGTAAGGGGEREGFPGAPGGWGVWGAMSGPPTSTDPTRAWLRPPTAHGGLADPATKERGPTRCAALA